LNFCSDNVTGASPEILEALMRANNGSVSAYGADPLTAQVQEKLGAIFERELQVFLVATGTSANALSLAVMAPPFGAIYCHADSHVQIDECGAPEFYTGGAKLVDLPGEHGKLSVQTIEMALERAHKGDVHRPPLIQNALPSRTTRCVSPQRPLADK
jgi:threonine aldolase